MVLYRVCGWPSAGVQESQEGRAECGWHSPRCSLTFGPCCAQAVLDASHEVHYLVFTQRSNLGTVSRLNCLLPVVRLDGPLTWQPHYPAAFLGEPVVRRKGNEPAQAYPGYSRACWGRACEVSVHTRLRLLLRKSLSFPWAPSWQRVSWGVGEGGAVTDIDHSASRSHRRAFPLHGVRDRHLTWSPHTNVSERPCTGHFSCAVEEELGFGPRVV